MPLTFDVKGASGNSYFQPCYLIRAIQNPPTGIFRTVLQGNMKPVRHWGVRTNTSGPHAAGNSTAQHWWSYGVTAALTNEEGEEAAAKRIQDTW